VLEVQPSVWALAVDGLCPHPRCARLDLGFVS